VSQDYVPIEDYGAIGNLRTVALVSRLGSIDWCCLPRLDSGSVFAALLDRRRGGRFRIGPAGAWRRGEQHYVAGTNVLETHWDLAGARLTLTDFMPLRGSITGSGDPPTAPRIFRILRAHGEACAVELEWSPRFDYARARMQLDASGPEVFATAGSERVGLTGLPVAPVIIPGEDEGPVLRARFTVRPSNPVPLLCWYGETEPAWPLAGWERALRTTTESWLEWVHAREHGERADFAGEWQPLLERSGLALKLLTYPSTGAIAAAATASLPEEIGGERNWDYRYTWIRDASFTGQALVALGHRREAIDFLQWVERISMRDGQPRRLHLMYTLHGETEIPETVLEHLEGYRGSRPVRIGNKAAEQFQLDIYGELLDAAYELARLDVGIDEDLWRFLTHVTDEACRRWREPDFGIWEVRSKPRHFVYSKLMVYVALDRALRLAQRFRLRGDLDRWRRTRDKVRRTILERGFDEERGAFVQAFGSQALDAANLLIPVAGLLDVHDPRVQATIDRSLEELTEGGVVYRYRTDQVDDGLAGHEGAFGLTTFWMVDALALSGRLEEAQAMFEGAANRVNHVGLFAEQFDPGTGAFLGNFPQAFTHLGLINSAIYIAHAAGKPIPSPPPIGSPEEQRESAGAGTTPPVS
jgi:GH15 family glucan-1,4-alpha-glucosidase